MAIVHDAEHNVGNQNKKSNCTLLNKQNANTGIQLPRNFALKYRAVLENTKADYLLYSIFSNLIRTLFTVSEG